MIYAQQGSLQHDAPTSFAPFTLPSNADVMFTYLSSLQTTNITGSFDYSWLLKPDTYSDDFEDVRYYKSLKLDT